MTVGTWGRNSRSFEQLPAVSRNQCQRGSPGPLDGAGMKDLESLDAAFVIDTFLLLLIGIGPKIALVPFLDATADMPEVTKRRVLRKMLTTAAIDLSETSLPKTAADKRIAVAASQHACGGTRGRKQDHSSRLVPGSSLATGTPLGTAATDSILVIRPRPSSFKIASWIA